MNINTLKENLELAKNAAIKAGNFLNSQKDNEKLIFSEVGRDIKLNVDRETETLIREELSVSKIPVHGEEYGEIGKNEGLSWIVDPLDGTSNYFRGLDQSCICIALEDNSEIIIGIIFNFNTNQMYYAAKNFGAFMNGKRITVSDTANMKDASLTTGFPASVSIDESLEKLKDLAKWKKIRMFGSAGLSCAYVAAGNCDCYIETGIYLWDFAAGVCLVNEAGGVANFKKISQDTYSVYFSNGRL